MKFQDYLFLEALGFHAFFPEDVVQWQMLFPQTSCPAFSGRTSCVEERNGPICTLTKSSERRVDRHTNFFVKFATRGS
jgi:hypothetical protein